MTKQNYVFLMAVLMLLTGTIQAQKSSDTINEKALQYAVRTEITDVAGKLHKGRLVYADSSSIVVLPLMNKKSELLKIQADQLIKIRIRKTHTFGRRFGNAMAVSAGLYTVVIINEYSKGSAIMIGPGAMLLILTTITGTPAALITAAANIPQTDIEYITKGEEKEYHKLVPYISQNGIVRQKPDSAIKLQAKPNEQALWSLEKPKIDKSPQSSLPFHFNINTGLNYLNFSQQITEAPNYGFTDDFSKDLTGSKLSMKIKFNLNNKIRPFISFPGMQGFSFSDYNSSGHRMAFWYKSFQVAAGADYHFKTVKRIFQNRFEYSAGIGAAAAFLRFDSQYSLNSETYLTLNDLHHRLYGMNINSSADYYIAPHVSITAGISSNIFFGGKYPDLNFSFNQSENIIIDSIKTHAFDLSLNLGLSIHI
jgi:hypothetical protein